MGSTQPSELNGSDPVYDVLIVGAGLSGLQAAVDIHNTGLTYLILEARDRIGGKTLSALRPDGKGKQEFGAAWINDTNQSRMWSLASSLGLATSNSSEGGGIVVQNTTGDVVVQGFPGEALVRFPYGAAPEYASKEETDDCIRIRDLVETTALTNAVFRAGSVERTRLDSMSFEAYLYENSAGRRARATAQVWTHAMLGVDPGEVSALYFLEYCRCGGGLMTMRSDCEGGGQYLRFQQGTSRFAEGLAERLREGRVRLGTPVVGVEQTEEGVVVKASNGGSFRGKKLIVSVPTPVYKHIQWSPPLPAEKKGVVDQTRYGCYTKYIALFKKPFWRDSGCCGLTQSFVGPVSVTRDTSVDDEENYAMTCFIGGVFARKWSALPTEEKRRSVLEQLGAVFAEGLDISDLCLGAMESPWLEEPWSGWGCPCPVMPPGVLDKGFEALCAPHGNVHFIGTETATVWRGYMEGAIRSGDRGAMEVVEALRRSSSTKG